VRKKAYQYWQAKRYITKKTARKRPGLIEYPDSEHVIFFGSSKNKLISDIACFISRMQPKQ